MFKAAIFDLDGTLIDSMCLWEDVVIDFLRKRGISDVGHLVAEIAYMSLSESSEYVAKTFHLTETPAQVVEEWNGMVRERYETDIPMKPGVPEYLAFLKAGGIKMCVATSNFRDVAETVLKRHGIFDYFITVITAQDVGRNKEFPDIYLKASELLGEKAEDCMVFEDILQAMRTAKAIPMQVTGVYDTSSAKEAEGIKEVADYYIKDFRELISC